MVRNIRFRLLLACTFFVCCQSATAQTITIIPSDPIAGEPVGATLTQPFDCTAPQPQLSVHTATSFTFDSVLPSGIVNCAVIPVPPPTISNFSVDLGALTAGNYTVFWNIYVDQTPNPPLLRSSATTNFVVAAGVPAPGAAGPAATPTIPLWAMLGLGIACLTMGGYQLKRHSR